MSDTPTRPAVPGVIHLWCEECYPDVPSSGWTALCGTTCTGDAYPAHRPVCVVCQDVTTLPCGH